MVLNNRVELSGYVNAYNNSEGYITFSVYVEKKLGGQLRKYVIDCYANKIFREEIEFYKFKNRKIQVIGHLKKFKCNEITQQWVVVERLGSR